LFGTTSLYDSCPNKNRFMAYWFCTANETKQHKQQKNKYTIVPI